MHDDDVPPAVNYLVGTRYLMLLSISHLPSLTLLRVQCVLYLWLINAGAPPALRLSTAAWRHLQAPDFVTRLAVR